MRHFQTHKLSKTDKWIMDFFWTSGSTDIMARDVLQYAHQCGKNWSHQNVANYLKNLQTIGMLSADVRGGKYYYHPTMSAYEYSLLPAKQVMHDVFNGSVGKFTAALTKPGPGLTDEDIEELEKLIEDYKND